MANRPAAKPETTTQIHPSNPYSPYNGQRQIGIDRFVPVPHLGSPESIAVGYLLSKYNDVLRLIRALAREQIGIDDQIRILERFESCVWYIIEHAPTLRGTYFTSARSLAKLVQEDMPSSGACRFEYQVELEHGELRKARGTRKKTLAQLMPAGFTSEYIQASCRKVQDRHGQDLRKMVATLDAVFMEYATIGPPKGGVKPKFTPSQMRCWNLLGIILRATPNQQKFIRDFLNSGESWATSDIGGNRESARYLVDSLTTLGALEVVRERSRSEFGRASNKNRFKQDWRDAWRAEHGALENLIFPKSDI